MDIPVSVTPHGDTQITAGKRLLIQALLDARTSNDMTPLIKVGTMLEQRGMTPAVLMQIRQENEPLYATLARVFGYGQQKQDKSAAYKSQMAELIQNFPAELIRYSPKTGQPGINVHGYTRNPNVVGVE